MKFKVCVVTSKRAANVEKMLNRLQGVEDLSWFVGHGEGDEYFCHGARNVFESGGLMDSRNAALEYAFADGSACVQVSDDLGTIKDARTGQNMQCVQVARTLVDLCAERRVKLAGVAPTANAFYFNENRAYRNDGFIVGDLFAALPSEPRFDTALRLKEDYDFTAQHLDKYGAVVRAEWVLATFAHRSNKGGAVDYRTEELEQQAIERLQSKWPGVFKKNPRRQNEILMRWKSRTV
jgi:hypothetical protein